MKFKFEEFKQFIGKEVVFVDNYLNLSDSGLAAGIITDFSVNRDFNDEQPEVRFKITPINCKQKALFLDWHSFKQDWGFKDTPFVKHLLREHKKKKNKKNVWEKEKEYNYPDDLKPAYKKALEEYNKSFGTIYWPVQDCYSKKWRLEVEHETDIRFWNKKAYVSPKNKNTSFWNEFKLTSLGAKFFLTKKEGLQAVAHLNFPYNMRVSYADLEVDTDDISDDKLKEYIERYLNNTKSDYKVYSFKFKREIDNSLKNAEVNIFDIVWEQIIK